MFTDKKAISEMLSYVMLIVIALALAALVFNYLEVLVPKEKPKCPEDISLIIDNVYCNASSRSLQLNVTNKGLFNIDAMYVRMGNQTKKVLNLINDPNSNTNNFFFINPIDTTQKALSPSSSYSWNSQNLNEISFRGNYALEIQAAVFVGKNLAVCENAISRQDVECVG